MSYCIICGAQLREGVNFCPSCGSKVQQQQVPRPQQPQSAPQQPTEVPPEQQSIQPPPQQQTAPMPPPQQPYQQQNVNYYPKKSYGKMLGAIIGVVIILIILLVVFFVLSGDDGNSKSDIEQKFIGIWETVYTDDSGSKSSSDYKVKFKEDNTFEAWSTTSGATNKGSWELKDGKISLPVNYDEETWFEYTFSNEDKTLTLYYSEGEKDPDTGDILYLEMRLNKIINGDDDSDGNGNLDSRFIGTWEVVQLIEDESSISVKWDWTFTFNSDGNVYENNDVINDQSTWSATSNQVCGEIFYNSDNDCYNFQFTQNDNTLTFDSTYYDDWDNQYHTYTLVLTKSN